MKMKLPLWVYDYKQRKYVVFPFQRLTTFEDGRRGFIYDPTSAEDSALIEKFGHLFEREEIYYPRYNGGASGLWNTLKFTLKEHPEKPKPKDPRWYSKEEHQIKKYKRAR